MHVKPQQTASFYILFYGVRLIAFIFIVIPYLSHTLPLRPLRLIFAPTALGLLVPNFSVELATDLQRHTDVARSASLRARAALANPSVTTRSL